MARQRWHASEGRCGILGAPYTEGGLATPRRRTRRTLPVQVGNVRRDVLSQRRCCVRYSRRRGWPSSLRSRSKPPAHPIHWRLAVPGQVPPLRLCVWPITSGAYSTVSHSTYPGCVCPLQVETEVWQIKATTIEKTFSSDVAKQEHRPSTASPLCGARDQPQHLCVP